MGICDQRIKQILVLTGAAAVTLTGCSSFRTSPLRAGFDAANMDQAIRPQDDLYRYTNGQWLTRTTIPADRSNFGTFSILEVDAEQRVRELLENAGSRAAGTPARRAADFYASFMDEKSVEQRGLTPLEDELARIDRLASPADVAAYMGHAQTLAIDEPLQWYVQQDARDATAYITGLNQGGLSLPDRDYYLKGDATYVNYRDALRKYIADLLQLGGSVDSQAGADRVIAIEMQLANAHWSRVQNRDPVATYNRTTMAQLAELAPPMDWSGFFAGVGAPVPYASVRQPGFVAALGAMLQNVPLADWRSYFRYKLLDAYAPLLPERFAQRHFDFHERTLSGTAQQRERWKRGVALVNDAAGEITGQLYVERYFSADSKRRMESLVANLLRTFDASIDGLDWMTPATRVEAKRKVATMSVKIGYPDKWRDYSSLIVRPDDLIGNAMRAARFEQERQRNQLGHPVDRGEWHMTPQTVNAYYNPTMNEVVFPAAILQPPFFDPRADDAVNYGGIGAVIGHEISHAFDDSGRQYDATGNLRDWWTAEDAERFKARTAALVGQFAAYRVLDDQALNGELTLGENIADLSGLAIAYKAYRLSLHGEDGRTIDGFSASQRFFLGWAQIWRRLYRDDNLRQRLSIDPHSPSEYRANGPVSNIDAFYESFTVRPGDKLYRKPEERIRIW